MKKNIYLTNASIMYHAKSEKGRSKHGEAKLNFINEFKNLGEYVNAFGLFLIVPYKVHSHFKSYLRNGFFRWFTLDLVSAVRALVVSSFGSKSKKISFRNYSRFVKGSYIDE